MLDKIIAVPGAFVRKNANPRPVAAEGRANRPDNVGSRAPVDMFVLPMPDAERPSASPDPNTGTDAPSPTVDARFRVDLRGVVDLLANHLYREPGVFLRELLQNAVDAVRAREGLAAKTPGTEGDEPGAPIRISVVNSPAANKGPTVTVEDDGIGLTEAEVHRFLATIGSSSKRDWRDLDLTDLDFIGRFGIGLLSCFMVADEIVVVTRSARSAEAPAFEWRGRSDGTYSLTQLGADLTPGTRVYVPIRVETAELGGGPTVLREVRRFGGLLPVPVDVVVDGRTERINLATPPWRRPDLAAADWREAALEFGRELLGERFLDAVPLSLPAPPDDPPGSPDRVGGVAYVLPFTPSPARRGAHRVYVRGMLISETVDNLLPDWAFFVTCVVDGTRLRPTASREALYDDAELRATRKALGKRLRGYLVQMAEHDPDRLTALLSLHAPAVKALALVDDDCFRTFVDWLTVETSLGDKTIGELRGLGGEVRTVRRVPVFRQIAPIARARGELVANGGYVYDADLMLKLGEVFGTPVREIGAADFVDAFEPLDADEQPRFATLLADAREVLDGIDATPVVRRFDPAELPVIYAPAADDAFRRSLRSSREAADDLWADVLGDVEAELTRRGAGDPPDALDDTANRLCLNADNPTVQRLAAMPNRDLRRLAVRTLFVQSLMLGGHPLDRRELALLTDSLDGLLSHAIGDGPTPETPDDDTD
jgi:molecular chaperone HtpG